MNLELTAGNVKQATVGISSRDLWQVPLAQIHVLEGFNIRVKSDEHESHVASLADSILSNGFYQSKPLAGYVALEDGKQRIYLTDGHCRLEAAMQAISRGAQIDTLPVVMSPKGATMEDLTVGLVANNSGNPLTQYEIGLVCKRLVGFGMEERSVAQRLCMNVQRVSDLLMLVGAPAAVRKLVSDGTVAASQAIETIKREGDGAVEKLTAGAEKAKAAGKKKATRKHIDSRPSYRAVVVELLEYDKAFKIFDCEAGRQLKTVIRMAKQAMG